eukprot:Gb_33054 [translate_table: standard]
MLRVLAARASAAAKTWQTLAYTSNNATGVSLYSSSSMSSIRLAQQNGQVFAKTYIQSSSGCGVMKFSANKLTYNSRSSEGLAGSAAFLSSSASPANNAFVRWYLRMLQKYPVLTKSITAGTICTLADVTSQGLSIAASGTSDKQKFDVPRTMRMAGYGLFLSGPTLHLWFNFLSEILPKRDVISTVKKITLGQTVYGPIVTTIFFSANAFLQGESGSEILARLKRDLIPTFRSGLMYWPLCDYITYKYVPVHLQPLISNSFAYIWTVYLTYMAGMKKVNVEVIPAS